ncbi:MAG: PadR family transcriptional regulator [Solirubrobacteraceae bacterium]
MGTYAFINDWQDAGPRGRHCHPMSGRGPGGPRHGRGGPDFGPDFGGPGFGGPGFGGRGGRGPGGRGRFGGRGPRAARGDIRAGILVLLSEEPMHGYHLMKQLAERSGGVWRPSPGSVYPTLSQLEDEGLVISNQGGGGRKLFELTAEGKAEVEARGDQPAPWDAVADEASPPELELRDVVFQVGAATRQVVHAGTGEQVTKAIEILKDARRKLYRVLAEDDDAPTTDVDLTKDDDTPAA